jgi:iron complex outermembrane recepter protein
MRRSAVPTHAVPVLLAGAVACGGLAAQETGREAVEIEPIEVIGVTPIHGLGLPKQKIPSAVQSATAERIEETRSLDLAEFLNRNLVGVHVNEAVANPFQPDVQYRGFQASPLLGLPQGMAVYQDGVRINEPFGDVVNWDLIPQAAIASINLMPGSNPLFGLNTLGGALSIQTKTGFTHPGSRAQAYGGSFGRRAAEFETGAQDGRLGYFVAGHWFDEDGWRDFSDSQVRQLFGSFGWRGDATTLDLTVTAADNELRGNGAAPVELLAIDREAVFTHPDITATDMQMLALRGSHLWSPAVVLDANLYYRRSDIDTFNGDDTEYRQCSPPNQAFLCEVEEDDDEEIVEDQFGNEVLFDERVASATNNTTDSRQRGYGGSLQATFLQELLGRENQLVAGVSLDHGRTRFRAATELARLTEDRGTVGSGLFDAEAFVNVHSRVRHYGAYLMNTWSATEAFAITVAGRYNHTEVKLRDQLGTALDGDHRFNRFNPAAGATYQLRPDLSVFGSYSESSRAPTPVELTCADPDDPCRLPNAFLADPPLEQVVARTWEAGLRGGTSRLGWTVAAFQTELEDDILFISSGALTNTGFFDNVGDTRRRGLEASLTGTVERLSWFANYTRVDAIFRDPLTVASPNHPLAVDGEIDVPRGARIPGIPRHMFKVGAQYALTTRLSIGGDALYNSSQFLRGDEANLLEPISGYTVVNLRGQYRVARALTVFAKVNNVFDRRFETFGLLGEADEVLGDDFEDPRFVSPGAPRGVWLGIEIRL